jgi:hypothetical protein
MSRRWVTLHEPVADRMAERIDVLEVIEIDVEDCSRLAALRTLSITSSRSLK